MRKILILSLMLSSSGILVAQENECESLVAEYETWADQTAQAIAKNNGKSVTSKELAEMKMDFEQWELNIEAFKKNGCDEKIYYSRIEKATLKARKSLTEQKKK
jgi:hypothetical protein